MRQYIVASFWKTCGTQRRETKRIVTSATDEGNREDKNSYKYHD